MTALASKVSGMLLSNHIALNDEERDMIADGSQALHNQCVQWFRREGGIWVLRGFPGWPESYFWDEFPPSVWSRCNEEIKAAVEDLIVEHKSSLVALWESNSAASENSVE